MLNYNRIYFCPPAASGIISLTDGSRELSPRVSGEQLPDPGILMHSGGHGDTLLKQPPGEMPLAKPSEINLPAELRVEIEPSPEGSYCNLLFTRDLTGLSLAIKWRDRDDKWYRTGDLVQIGELVSIRVPSNTTQTLSLTIQGLQDDPVENRPPLGLLAAWINPAPDRK